MQACIADYIEVNLELMTEPSVAKRTGDVENSLMSLHGWIRGLGVGAAVVVGLIGWWVHSELMPTIHDIQKDVKENNTRISIVEGNLATMKLHAAASLPINDFQQTIPELKSAIVTARKNKLTVPVKVMEDLQGKLLATDRSLSEYWPTAAEFISYRSSLLVGAIQSLSKTLRPCRPVDMDHNPNASAQLMGPDGKPTGPKSRITRYGEEDCYVELDGQTISGWDCTQCLIKYSGGPLSMRDVHFVNCLFVFDFRSGQPSGPDGPRVSTALLASGLRDVTIPAI